jgi:hypothetical protein
MEDWERLIVIVVTFLPTIYEAWTDRFGEKRTDKIKDTILLVSGSIILTAVAYLFLANWVAVPLFILVWRIVAFDYIVHAFLKRYSKGHKDIDIWKFSGKTSKIDQVLSKIDWRWRLTIRGALLILALLWFVN